VIKLIKPGIIPGTDIKRHRESMKLYDGYIFDLDGTVYLGDGLLPGAAETILYFRSQGRRTVFLSNNPTHTRYSYAGKLTRLGIPTTETEIINSSVVMVDFLQNRMPGARLFVVGEQPLMDELRAAGFDLAADAKRVDAVIASFDRTFVYRKLQIAFDAIRAGARFFATNADRYCPVPGGGEPDAAAMIAAIEACTGVQVEAVVGKPSEYMITAILRLLQIPAENCLITGDRLETDVQMGINAGMDAALTLTGATSLEMAQRSNIIPTYIIRNLGDLLD
jgi:NagD protein